MPMTLDPLDPLDRPLARWRPGAGLLVIAVLLLFAVLTVVGLVSEL